jgi:predicted RNA methylase
VWWSWDIDFFLENITISSVVKAIVSRDRNQFIAKAIVEFGLMMVKKALESLYLKQRLRCVYIVAYEYCE